MINRCNDPKSKGYEYYGGRGIRVCDRWMDFVKFYADMGPANGLTLDRLDSNGNYEPGNCRWATWKQQAETRRKGNAIRFIVNGRSIGVSEMAEQLGITRQALYLRLKKAD